MSPLKTDSTLLSVFVVLHLALVGNCIFYFKEVRCMRVTTWITGLSIGLLCIGLVAGCASYSTGGGKSHVAEAITHAQEGVDHGKMGHADAVVTHAEVALQHAQAAKNELQNPHLDAGIGELKEAITHGKAGHADVATDHATSAVMHLKEIK
jgi:hypothetical protein